MVSSKNSTRVALLRGINVGGKNLLPMHDLAALFAAAGCVDVRTYIQSGNVLFRTTSAVAKTLPQVITKAIFARAGLRVPVVTRTAIELETITRSNPFLAAGKDAGRLHVAFLLEVPKPERISALDPKRSPPDEFRVLGRDVYLFLPNGVARSKLTSAYLDTALGTTSTMRNWRTVLKLLELASA